MDPIGFGGAKSLHSGMRIPSESQSMFISTELLDSVNAYTENISAAYGDFLGGVVEAKYRDAAEDRWHVMVRGRHTRDQWANQHYFEDNEPEDYPTSNDNQHKRFKKSSVSAIVEGPVFDNLGIIMAYDRKWSAMPTYIEMNEPEEHTDRRLNENYFLRLNTKITDDLKAALTATYAPYSAKMYPPNYKDGEFEIKGGGYSLNLETQWDFSLGRWENSLSFSSIEASRDANSKTSYSWWSTIGGSPSKYANWTSARWANEGMMGDIENKQNTYELKTHFRFEEFETAALRHHIFTGLDLKYLYAKSSTEGKITYRAKKDPAVVGTLQNGVVDHEQYLKFKSVLHPLSRTQDYNTLAFFGEDSINIERVLVRPGVRVSWDSITKNTNIAPRIFANIDLLNDKCFNLFGGYNKYYGSQILQKALALPTTYYDYDRTLGAGGVPLPWAFKKIRHASSDQLGDLKTPYTDEYTAGISANILDTLFKVTYVDRRFEDQLRTHRVNKKYWISTNEGKTKYWGITLEVEKEFDLGTFGEHTCEFAVTQSSTKSNYAQWTNAFDETDSSNDSDYIKLDGEFIARDKAPVGNFAAPWVLTYTQEMRFWEGKFRVMPMVRGKTIRFVQNVSSGAPDGKKTKEYVTRNKRDVVNVDLSLALDVLDYKDNVLTLEMDITNLFDRRNTIEGSSGKADKPSCGMGRQIYAGLKYTF